MSSDTELESYRLAFRHWLSTVQVPLSSGPLDERFERLRVWQRTLADAGYVGVAWPVKWGGQGLTPLHQLVLNEELCRARAPQPIGLIGIDVVGPSIAKYGSDAQRELLAPLISGEHIWCQGFSEPGAGSDLAAISTSAARVPGGYVVNGQKIWTSWAHKAERCALLASTDRSLGRHGLSYLIVDMDSPGVEVRPIRQMSGDSEFCEIRFDDVEVPEENLMGQIGQGWMIAMDTLSNERGNYAMRRRVEIEVAFLNAVDQIRGVLDENDDELPDRYLELLGDSVVALEVLGSQNRQTAERMLAGTGPSPLDSVDKLILSSVEQRVHRSVFEFLGPAALTDSLVGGHLDAAVVNADYLYSRAASIYGGTEQVQRNIVAERLLGLPRGG